jgi:hypothetical protein
MALQTAGQGNVPEFIITLEPEVRGDICEKRSPIRAVHLGATSGSCVEETALKSPGESLSVRLEVVPSKFQISRKLKV